jgi:tetratricopeptide (TPR) repeat protein
MERTAVQGVAGYLSRGPQAIYEQLATKSPLRTLSQSDALQEIEVRLGPPNGTSWELQTVVPALKDKTAVFTVSYPSGLDESVTLDFIQENGAYRINSVRMLAETSPTPQIFPPLPTSDLATAAKPFDSTGITLALGLMAILMTGVAAFLVTSQQKNAMILTAMAVLLIMMGGAVAFVRDVRFDFRPQAALASIDGRAKPAVTRLASLLPLRRAMTAGTGGVDQAFGKVAVRGVCRDVAELWKAQADLQQLKTREVAKVLRRFSSPSDIPLVEMLRARLAFAEGNEVDTIVAYEHAANLGPGRDGLWLEAAQALSTLGFLDRAEQYLKRLDRIGSRDADVYYDAAFFAAMKNREEATEESLKKGWNLRPAERRDIIRAGAFWSVLRKASFADVISLSSAAEATFAAVEVASRSVVLPADATPRVSGNYLQITLGQQELGVPGGAALAPAGTPVVDAGVWNRSEDEKALAEFEQLLTSAASPGAFTQPLLRRRVERCANALASHNRWADVVRLTESLSPKSENVPVDLFFVRNLALQRTQRENDAKQLLAELAVSRVMQRRNDPASMERLGEMLASVDLYDAAIKLLEKSAALRQNGMIDDRVRQILMNKRLATKYATTNRRTSKFTIPMK